MASGEDPAVYAAFYWGLRRNMTRLLSKVGVGWQIGFVSLIALLGFFVIGAIDGYVSHQQALQRAAMETLTRAARGGSRPLSRHRRGPAAGSPVPADT